MCISCATMALSVTPPAEDEGAKVDGAKKLEESPSLSRVASI